MEARSLQFIARACGGELIHGAPEKAVHRVCTDSREVQAGDVFFALAGDRFDGHDFLPQVVKTATAVVISAKRTPSPPYSCGIIAVADTRKALGKFAAQYRREFPIPMIAIGGSNGKTTTKELAAAVLRQKLSTLWSEASFNNDIGVPLTLLKLEPSHQAALLEAGTNHPGELEPLVRMIEPTYGVITSIGREHLEFFGDLAGVVQEEAWIGELLPAKGKLFLHIEEPKWKKSIAARTRAPLVTIGMSAESDWHARNLAPDRHGLAFAVESPLAQYNGPYRVNLVGRHQAINALFAIALGAELGLSRDQIARGLTECKPARMRLQIWEINGVRVLDDAYNANVDSMLAALRTLQDLPCKGRRLAVLGDMAELGAHSEAAHEEVGRHAAELGVGQLFAVGKMASVMARGARGAGLARVLEFADVETAAVAVKQFVRDGDVLLLKASRATRLERVGERLRGATASGKN